MSLYQVIKADALEARRRRDTATATSLTTLIGELETFAKNVGHEPTDADVVAFVRKTLKGVDEVLRLASQESSSYLTAVDERALFESYLPKQLTSTELDAVIDGIIDRWAAGQPTVGDVMKVLKADYSGQYDGATASALLKQKLVK
jgi:uncharacterized protein YqeY